MDAGGRGGGRAGAEGVRLDFIGSDGVTFTGAVEVFGQQMEEDFYLLF